MFKDVNDERYRFISNKRNFLGFKFNGNIESLIVCNYVSKSYLYKSQSIKLKYINVNSDFCTTSTTFN